ncbi:hypothetical protein [Pectobacterium phage vB_ParM-25]|nr:hypothetical protein [Pectobacterium phage vB_ParM-25]
MSDKIVRVYSGSLTPALSAVLLEYNTNQSAILQAANKPGEFILGKSGFHFLMVDDTVGTERMKFLSDRNNYPDATVVISCISTKFSDLVALGYISSSHMTIDVIDGELCATVNRSNYLSMGAVIRICY